MNIKDLQPSSYKVISQGTLNIKDLPQNSFSIVPPEPAPFTGNIFANTPEAAMARRDTAFIGGKNNFIKNDIAGAFTGGIGQVKEGYNQAKNATNPLQLLEGGTKLAAGAVNAAFSPLAPVFHPISQGIGYVADKISDIPQVQKFAQSSAGQTTSRIAEDVGNVASIAQGVAGIDAGGPKVVEKISEIPSEMTDKYIKSEKSNWEKPTTKTAPAYKKATELYEAAKKRGTDIGQVLIDNKIKLSDHLDTNATGKQVYNTADTAIKLREDAGKISTDLIRPSLQEYDLGHPPIDGSLLKDKAIENIRRNKDLTSGDKETLIDNIRKEPLGDTYTKEKLLDEKIVRDKNAKYSPVGDIATNLKATMNKALADSARNLMEKDLSKEIPVHEVNAEASKLYQTASYLDALHTKVVPRGLLSRFASGTAKIMGAVAGESLGGGILAGVGGYHLGGILERAFENMSDPIKSSILNSMEKSQPEVFNTLRQYIGDAETSRLMRKQLPPAPSARMENGINKIPSGNTIPLQERTAKPPTPAEVLPASKYPTTQNPKSGKFQKVYSTSPK